MARASWSRLSVLPFICRVRTTSSGITAAAATVRLPNAATAGTYLNVALRALSTTQRAPRVPQRDVSVTQRALSVTRRARAPPARTCASSAALLASARRAMPRTTPCTALPPRATPPLSALSLEPGQRHDTNSEPSTAWPPCEPLTLTLFCRDAIARPRGGQAVAHQWTEWPSPWKCSAHARTREVLQRGTRRRWCGGWWARRHRRRRRWWTRTGDAL
jgi:hypothetical protein